jgi:hypothetical protein
MKTAMQELYESLRNSRPSQWNDLLIHDEKRLKEKEKEQIIQAHEKGLSSMGFQTADFKSGNKYYHRIFGDSNEAER